ncbi:helicase-associated domain-containing protein [Paenibacillus turpanensis]|uniref:helicase-associated domain-containing protein n=1 Tax=Paenibacillus turpanensis TaxID=2689078 RepID=UPI00140B108C|nr:helicase-associated domain-containing protein [Paenibacillus turpanensis]
MNRLYYLSHMSHGDQKEEQSKPLEAGVLAKSLNKLEREALLSVLRSFAGEPFTEEELVRAAPPGQSGAEMRVGLMLLRKKNIVFSLMKSWGERVFVLPKDTLSCWQEALLPEIAEAVRVVSGEQPVSVEAPCGRGIVYDLLAVLAALSRQEAPLTGKGVLHRKLVQKLTAQVEADAERVSGIGIRYRNDDVYPVQLALVLDLALSLGLVAPQNGVLAVQENVLSQLFQEQLQGMHRKLFELFLERAGCSDPWLQHAEAAFDKAHDTGWLSVNGFRAVLEESGIVLPSSREAAEAALLNAWLLPWSALGWAEAGKSAGGEWLFRVQAPAGSTDSAEEETEAGVFVQPDYEVIVPPDCPLELRWELEHFAEHLQTDQVSRYRLSRESFRLGQGLGRDPQRFCSLLEAQALFGIPEQVECSLREWADRTHTASILQLTVLRSEETETADKLAVHPRISPLLGARIGERYFEVDPQQADKLRELLRQEGYALERGTVKKDSVSPNLQKPEEGQESGLVLPRHALHLYRVEKRAPTLDTVYPELKAVPPMWLNESRPYHAATQKQILQKAIEWQSSVKLRTKAGALRLQPLRVTEDSSGWNVSGRTENGEIRLQYGDWEEMQLILPGINDK